MHTTPSAVPAEQEHSDFASFIKENIGQHLRDKCIDFSSPSTATASDLATALNNHHAANFDPATATLLPCQEQDQNVMPGSRGGFDANGRGISICFKHPCG
jgi:hypothetical protein